MSLGTCNVLSYALDSRNTSGGSVGILQTETRKAFNDLYYFLDTGCLTYTPTFSWTQTGPASMTTSAWYKQVGKLVWFGVHAEAASAFLVSNSGTSMAATALTVSLPTPTSDLDVLTPVNAIMLNTNATWGDPMAYIDATGTAAKIIFRNFLAPHTANVSMDISGWYIGS